MCIERPASLPDIEYPAFKVMAKVDGGYRPIYPSGLNDQRIFKPDEWYVAEGLESDVDAGFHGVWRYQAALDMFNYRCRRDHDCGIQYALLVVSLRTAVVYEQSNNFLCDWFSNGIRGANMKIIAELKVSE